jgi:adenylylsulfate kinase
MAEKRRKTLAVDFDGVIADYSEGDKGKGVFGSPIEGAAEYLQKLHDEGWMIIIWTAREEEGLLKKYLDANRIPYDHVNENPDQTHDSRKIFADVYLDDMGITFRGNWEKAYNEIKGFKSWEGKKRNG